MENVTNISMAGNYAARNDGIYQLYLNAIA